MTVSSGATLSGAGLWSLAGVTVNRGGIFSPNEGAPDTLIKT